jgi:hypothetical protein
MTPGEAEELREGLTPHPFLDGYSGMACVHMVERDGSGEDCGLPADDAIHHVAAEADPFRTRPESDGIGR